MMSDETDADFDACIRRARLVIDTDRIEVMRQAYRDFQRLLALLDEPLTYADEPASIIDLDRSGGTR